MTQPPTVYEVTQRRQQWSDWSEQSSPFQMDDIVIKPHTERYTLDSEQVPREKDLGAQGQLERLKDTSSLHYTSPL